MNRERLLVGLAAVFAGLTMLLVVVALARQPFLLLLAIPFGVTTYLLWYHVSGRLAARIRRQEARRFAREGHGEESRARADTESRRRRGMGGQRGARAASGSAREQSNRQRDRRSRWDQRQGGQRQRRRQRQRQDRDQRWDSVGREPGMSIEEASRVLGVDAGADAAAVKRAYREKVKSVHPDTSTGDEATFKRVTRAYERLSEN